MAVIRERMSGGEHLSEARDFFKASLALCGVGPALFGSFVAVLSLIRHGVGAFPKFFQGGCCLGLFFALIWCLLGFADAGSKGALYISRQSDDKNGE